MKKHYVKECADTTATAEEITEALKETRNVERMLLLQECGLEVVPVQGGIKKEKPWLVKEDKKRFEKSPSGKPITQQEWDEWDAREEERVGSQAPLNTRKSYTKKGEPSFRYIDGLKTLWFPYGKKNPLSWGEDDDTLDFLEDHCFASGVIFNDDLIGIDADTPEEVETLRDWWYKITGEEDVQWTVKTPGVVKEGENGERVHQHKAGGHIWIRMPEGWTDSLPHNSRGNTTVGEGDTAFAIHRNGSYFLTPHSSRSEGSYVLTGEVVDATTEHMKPLVDAIIKEFTPEVAAPLPGSKYHKGSFIPRSSYESDTAARLEEWSENRSWGSIFQELGWSFTTGTCSGGECVEFTHPSSKSGSHSGVAHGANCTSGPVKDAVTIYSSTAQTETGLEGLVKKYKFVLEVLYSGSTDSFFASEPVLDTKGMRGGKPQNQNDSDSNKKPNRYTSNRRYGL